MPPCKPLAALQAGVVAAAVLPLENNLRLLEADTADVVLLARGAGNALGDGLGVGHERLRRALGAGVGRAGPATAAAARRHLLLDAVDGLRFAVGMGVGVGLRTAPVIEIVARV